MISYGFGCSLDAINQEDLESLRTWRNDQRIYRWCRQNDLITQSDQRDWYEKQRKDSNIRMFLIRGDGMTPVGVCGLTSIDLINQRAEFSLYIQPNAQGLGYGTRALKTLFQYGFNEMNLHLIWGETFADNNAKNVFEKIGMVKEGVRRDYYFKDGKYVDCILYSVKRDEFFCGLKRRVESYLSKKEGSE